MEREEEEGWGERGVREKGKDRYGGIEQGEIDQIESE